LPSERDKDHFAYNVDAFLAAARSVLDYAYTHVRAKDQEAGHEDASRWYEEAVGAESTPGNDLSEPLRLLRNESIHQWPVRISWHEDKYYFHAPNLPGQDVLTLCETHLTRLEDILAEGREKGHLPGRRVELIPIEDGNPTVQRILGVDNRGGLRYHYNWKLAEARYFLERMASEQRDGLIK